MTFSTTNRRIEASRHAEFQRLEGVTYLDHSGSTLYAKSQVEGYAADLQSNIYGNPHSGSSSSRLTADTIDQIRYRILQHFNTSPDEYSVIFTSGCTAALKLVSESFQYSCNVSQTSCGDFQPSCEQDQDTSSSDPLVVNATTYDANESHDKAHTQDIDGDNINITNLNGAIESTVKNAGAHAKLQGLKSASTSDNNDGGHNGCFCYFVNSHTSVLGMREVAAERHASVVCLDETQITTHIDTAHRSYLHSHHNNLFAYPAQCNFSGRKYSPRWISAVHHGALCGIARGQWYCLLDAASFVTTSKLDLDAYKPDFVTISFYKMFGFPTGIGALLVRTRCAGVLRKCYFGGGTVQMVLPHLRQHVPRLSLHDRFEDGTVSFLEIIALRHGFDTLHGLAGGIRSISGHTFHLAWFTYQVLCRLRHANNQPLAALYCDTTFDDVTTQGPIVNFNLLRPDGSYIGFAEVDKLAQLHDIHLRTGCFCNIGACQHHLGLTTHMITQNFQAGHVCGDSKDLIDGRPTGSIRASYGYMSTLADAKTLLNFIIDCFMEDAAAARAIIDAVENEPCPCHVVTEEITPTDTCRSSSTKDSVPTSIARQITAPCPEMEQHDKPHVQDKKATSVLTNIFIYPVKSCGGFEVSNWDVGPLGLLYDRQWMIVAASGVCLSQKRAPRMCLIRPTIDRERGLLILNFSGFSSMEVGLPYDSQSDSVEATICHTKVCGDRITGFDCGEEAADWLTQVLGQPCRLIRHSQSNARKSKLRLGVGSQISLANESQYLLINRSSVKALREKILQRLGQPSSQITDINNLVGRFRGNLVVEAGEAYQEDDWTTVVIGTMTFKSAGGCSRCQMVCVDQTTAERHKEPLKTLALSRGSKIPFGIHLTNDSDSCGTMAVGDKVITGTSSKTM